MNIWNLSADDRLNKWLQFRKELNQLSLEQAIEKTCELWKTVRFAPYYLHPNEPETWPDPWTLISENYFCDLAKALGIMYTMYFTDHSKQHSFELRIYKDSTTHYYYNLVWIDGGKYILNLIDGSYVNIEQFDETLMLEKAYNTKKLKFENY